MRAAKSKLLGKELNAKFQGFLKEEKKRVFKNEKN
jgi:hypothetical protein